MNEVKSRNLRYKYGKILVEGRRHINDAIASGATPLIIYFTLQDTLSKINNLHKFPKLKIHKLLFRDMKLWSDLTTPGIMAIFNMPNYEEIMPLRTNYLPMNLIIDSVRQPDNLGAIIRTAAAAGCDKIILMKGCVDQWNPKVIRGGCGAHFRIPILSEITWEKIENYCSEDCQVIIGNKKDLKTADSSKMGQIRLAIQQDIEENEKNEITYETDENGHKFYIDETYLDEDKMELYKSLGMESTPYYDIDIDPKKEINIVIGGETEGLSGAAFRFARKHYGVCANIPLANDIESLNSAVACGILSYHVQNKYLKHSVDYANLLSQNNS